MSRTNKNFGADDLFFYNVAFTGPLEAILSVHREFDIQLGKDILPGVYLNTSLAFGYILIIDSG